MKGKARSPKVLENKSTLAVHEVSLHSSEMCVQDCLLFVMLWGGGGVGVVDDNDHDEDM